MADLVTHAALGHAGVRWFDPRTRAVFLVGAVLPDVLFKGGLWLLGGATWFCEPTHSPLALILVAYAGALFFEEAFRRRAFFALWAGAWSHVLVDAGKSHMGEGVILWAFPFSMDRFELGLYEPDETVCFILPAIAIALAVELVFRLTCKQSHHLVE